MVKLRGTLYRRLSPKRQQQILRTKRKFFKRMKGKTDTQLERELERLEIRERRIEKRERVTRRIKELRNKRSLTRKAARLFLKGARGASPQTRRKIRRAGRKAEGIADNLDYELGVEPSRRRKKRRIESFI